MKESEGLGFVHQLQGGEDEGRGGGGGGRASSLLSLKGGCFTKNRPFWLNSNFRFAKEKGGFGCWEEGKAPVGPLAVDETPLLQGGGVEMENGEEERREGRGEGRSLDLQ